VARQQEEHLREYADLFSVDRPAGESGADMYTTVKVPPRQRLSTERIRHRWSQLEVADQLGTTPGNVSRWERGLTSPGPYFRSKLCELFGRSAQELGLTWDESDGLTTYVEGKIADLLASKAHLPAIAAHLIHAHAYEHVPLAQGSFPVALFSPGIGTPPVEYTSTVEDVDSHGYIVVMLYHTYSVPFTVFADGRVALLNEAGIRSENEPAGTSDAQTNQDRNAIGSVWVADARFTLDQLTKLNSDDKLLKT